MKRNFQNDVIIRQNKDKMLLETKTGTDENNH